MFRFKEKPVTVRLFRRKSEILEKLYDEFDYRS